MSSFSQIAMMSSALRSFQRELDVTGHNISNVDTTGYSRQSANLVAQVPGTAYEGKVLSMGNGVTVSSVNRVRDMFLEARRLDATSELGKLSSEDDAMSKIERVMLETDSNGIGSALDGFFNSWSSLSSNPNQSSWKLQVQNAGNTLATRVRQTYANLQDQKNAAKGDITSQLQKLQSLSNTVATLNDQIRVKSADGAVPNDLLDQRDQALRDMADITDISVQKFGDGSYVVSTGSLVLVNQYGAAKVPTTFDASTNTLSDASGSYKITSGSISGLFGVINNVNSYQSRLDTFANTLRTEVNNIFSGGVTANGATGLKFFNDVTSGPQTGAIDFALDTTGVVGPPAAAGVGTDYNSIVTGTTSSASDGTIALALSELRDTNVAGIGNVTFTSFYANIVGDVGRDAANATAAKATQGSIVTQIDNQIQSVSGVSLDEEMANMLRFQRSYQAAAKALSMFDSLMDDLLSIIR